MKIGVLGTGFGAYHAELYSKLDAVDKVYVFGRKPEKLKELQQKFGIVCVTDLNEIIENDEIDLIDICLPSVLHKKYGIMALEHGKHVFCETPVAYSLEDANAMVKAQQNYNKQFMVDLFIRFDYAYETLASIAVTKKYGNIRKIQIQRYTPPFFGDLGPQKIATDLMIHDIDFVTSLLGSTMDIKTSYTLGKEGQCAVSALCSYENAFAEINASSMMPYGYPFAVSYEVIFDTGVVRYYEDGYEKHLDTKLSVWADGKQEELPLETCNSYENAIRYAIKMAGSNEKPINDVSEAAASLAMALEIQRQILQ